jgi:hypothetical protein
MPATKSGLEEPGVGSVSPVVAAVEPPRTPLIERNISRFCGTVASTIFEEPYLDNTF